MHATLGRRSNTSDANAAGWSDESIAYAAAGAVAGSLLLALGIVFVVKSRRPLSAPAGTPAPSDALTPSDPPFGSGLDVPADGTPLPPSPSLAFERGQDINFLRPVVLYEGEDDERGTTYPAQAALTVAPSAHRTGRWYVHLNNGYSGWADLTA